MRGWASYSVKCIKIITHTAPLSIIFCFTQFIFAARGRIFHCANRASEQKIKCVCIIAAYRVPMRARTMHLPRAYKSKAAWADPESCLCRIAIIV
jgi:hypothetical protein